jgi:peptidase M16-like protein
MRFRIIPVALCLLFGSPALGGGASSKLESFTLDNGLTVVIRHVTSAKDAAVAVVYKVGNRHDPEGRSGTASVIAALYHAVATGKTAARSADSLALRWPKGSFHQLGWTEVAADDHTLLARTLPVEDLSKEIDDAADRMAGLTVTENDLRTAVSDLEERLDNIGRGVVPSEAARLLARERLVALPHGGRRPGRSDEIGKLTLEEVRRHLKEFYVPANAILSITGEVAPAALKTQIQKRFGAIPRVDPPAALAAPAEKPAPDPSAPPEVLELPPAAMNAAAALALRAPQPGATAAYAAYLVLVTRLYDAWYAASSSGGGADIVSVSIDILRDAEAVYLVSKTGASDAAKAGDRLRSTLAAALAKPPSQTDFLRTRTLYNKHFGVAPTEGSWADDPLSVAHADARMVQLGLDGEAVMKLVSAVTAKDLKEAAARSLVVVVARPGK